MMGVQTAKAGKTVFFCMLCGFESRKWLGRCPDCGAWDSLSQSTAQSPAISTAVAEV